MRLTGIEAHFAGQEAVLAGRNEDLGVRRRRVQGVERTDVIDMRMGQGDARNGRAAARMAGADPEMPVSISVSPSSSRTR